MIQKYRIQFEKRSTNPLIVIINTAQFFLSFIAKGVSLFVSRASYSNQSNRKQVSWIKIAKQSPMQRWTAHALGILEHNHAKHMIGALCILLASTGVLTGIYIQTTTQSVIQAKEFIASSEQPLAQNAFTFSQTSQSSVALIKPNTLSTSYAVTYSRVGVLYYSNENMQVTLNDTSENTSFKTPLPTEDSSFYLYWDAVFTIDAALFNSYTTCHFTLYDTYSRARLAQTRAEYNGGLCVANIPIEQIEGSDNITIEARITHTNGDEYTQKDTLPLYKS